MDILILSVIASVLLIVITSIGFYFKSGQVKGKHMQIEINHISIVLLTEQERPRPQLNRLRNEAPRRAQMARNRGTRLRANGIYMPCFYGCLCIT